MDIWDVWSLQVAIVVTLAFQGIMTVALLCGLLYLRSSYGCNPTSETRDKRTLLTEDNRCRHYDLKCYIRQLGKALVQGEVPDNAGAPSGPQSPHGAVAWDGSRVPTRDSVKLGHDLRDF